MLYWNVPDYSVHVRRLPDILRLVRVIIGAAPFDTVDAAIVYGVNHHEIKASDQIISSVSCTTQALVPLVKIIDDAFGIDTAMMTEIHAVTADQTVLDKAHRDLSCPGIRSEYYSYYI